MARKVDDLGRIVLPVELRRLHGIQTGDALEISVDGDAIVLRKLSRSCVFCGAEEALSHYRSRPLCAGCRSDLSDLSDLSGEDGAQPHTPAVSAY